MAASTKLNKKRKTSASIILFTAGLFAGILIMIFINGFDKNTQQKADNNTVQLIMQTDSLQSGFSALQALNEKYASVLSDKNLDSLRLKTLDSLSVLIANTQVAFKQKLDAIEMKKNNYDKNAFSLLNRIADGYRAAVEQSSSLNNIRKAFNIGNTNYNTGQAMLNNMQNELDEKNMEIAALANSSNINTNFSQKKFPVDYKGMIKMQDSVLNVVLLSEKKRNDNLKNYNNKLTLENDKLITALDSIRNADHQVLFSSTISKQKLNEQVNLARADCYLARADIKQTVSSDKQRKELLEHALQILNELTQSSDENVKEEAQNKLAELKTIASNNHD